MPSIPIRVAVFAHFGGGDPGAGIEVAHDGLVAAIVGFAAGDFVAAGFELAADAAAAAGVAGSAEEANGHAPGQAPAVHIAAVHAACITACELVIKDAHLAGCTTLSLASSEWTRATADPMVRNFVICFVCSCTL